MTTALRQLRDSYLGWPTPERKAVIKAHIHATSGFRGCVGSGDGSLIRFAEAPAHVGHAYVSRKKFVGVCQNPFFMYCHGVPGIVLIIW